MKRQDIWEAVDRELRKSRKSLHWPDHPSSQAGLVSKESGKLMTSCLDWKYNRNDSEIVREEQIDQMKASAVQTIVMAFRFLENI